MKNIEGIERLLTEAIAGNKKAENELFSKLRARFLSIVQHRIYDPGKNPNEIKKDAEDIVQDTMITILQKYKNVVYEKGFLNWTFGVLRNKIGDYFKRKKVKPMPNNDEIIDPDQIEPNIDLIGLKGIIEKEIINLSKDCKKIIKALLQGYSTGNIISMFPDIPRNTIDSKIHRCRQILKDILEKGGYLE